MEQPDLQKRLVVTILTTTVGVREWEESGFPYGFLPGEKKNPCDKELLWIWTVMADTRTDM